MYIYTESIKKPQNGFHPWVILGASLGDLWVRIRHERSFSVIFLRDMSPQSASLSGKQMLL